MLYWPDTCRFPGGGGSALLCHLHLGQHFVVRGLCRPRTASGCVFLAYSGVASLTACWVQRIVEE